MGTPERISVAYVRQKRESAILWIKLPKIGARTRNLSRARRPFGVAVNLPKPNQAAQALMPTAHQYDFRKADKSLRNCVGAGSLAPKSANIAANTGITKIRSTFTNAIARPMTAIGYVIADFTFFVSLTVDSK